MKTVFVFCTAILTLALFSELKAKIFISSDSIISLSHTSRYTLDHQKPVSPIVFLKRDNQDYQINNKRQIQPFQFNNDKKFHFLQIQLKRIHPKKRLMEITTGRANRNIK